MKKKNKIIIMLLVLIGVGLIGSGVFVMYSDKNPNATGNDYELEEKTTTSYQGKFSVYRTDSNFYKQPNSFMKEYEIINITCRPTVAE